MTSLDAFAAAQQPDADTPKGWEAGVEVGPEGGTICSGPVAEPIQDWSDILRIWNLDPEYWEVVGNATFKAWDGYAKDNDGNIVTKRLFSYKVSIRLVDKAAVPQETVDAWQRKLLGLTPLAPVAVDSSPCTYLMAVADPQIGKKGTAEALANWERGVLQHVAKIQNLRARGFNIERVLLAFQGDEHEQVANSYPNQPHTVELNFSQQIETDFSMRVWTIEQVASLGIPTLVTSVISNHGEWTRNGSKDVVTSKADNSSTCVMRLVQQLVERIPTLSHVAFEIAESNPDIVLETSGVSLSLSHGHIAKGRGSSSEQRTKNAIERQILGRTKELVDTRIFVVAHYHHFYMIEFEGRTLFGCPALEAERSSEYMLDQWGVWSPPGMLGFLIGEQWPRGWSEVAVL